MLNDSVVLIRPAHRTFSGSEAMQLNFRFAPFALAIFAIAGLVACSSTPDPTPDELPLDLGSAEELLQSDDVLLAGRVDLDELGDLGPLLALAADAVEQPLIGELASAADDPLTHLEQTYNLPGTLSALDSNRPLYVMVTDQGNQDFLRATSLGLPTDLDEWPSYVNVRLLVPTDTPDVLITELGPWLDGLANADVIGAHRLFDESGFVRAELALPYIGAGTTRGGVDPDGWIEGLELDEVRPPAQADLRPTPAFEALIEGDAPLGVWAPVDTVTALATYEILELFARDYRRMSESGQPRFFLQGVARLAAPSVADDPLSAETEDFSLTVSSDEGALLVDFHATRTAQGQRVRQQRSQTLDLPALTDVDGFLHLSAQADLAAIGDTVLRPHWTTLDDPSDFASPDFDPMADSALPFTDDVSGLLLTSMALQYPWTALSIAGESVGFIPLPQAIRAHLFDGGASAFIPAGVALAALFDDGPGTRQAVEMLLAQGEEFIPGMLDAEIVVRSDERFELHAALGASLSETFGISAAAEPVEGQQLSIDLSALQQTLPGFLTAEDADAFGHVHLRGHSSDHFVAQRLTIGAAEPVAASPIESRLNALTAPTDRCRTELAALATKHLADLRTAPTEHVSRWADALQQQATQCLGADHPDIALIEERIDVARQLADQIP